MAAFYAWPNPDKDHLEILENYLIDARERLTGFPDYKGDSDFLHEAINTLDFYMRLCREQNRSLVNLSSDQLYTIEDSLLIRRIIASILVEENRNNSRLLEQQKQFAIKHGMVLVRTD